MGKQLRLDKLLADTGRWSRREAKSVIRQGGVTVNGVIARREEEKADPETDTILVEGQPLGWQAHCYLMLHKPEGVLTATRDRRERTVLDLLPQAYRKPGLAPVGRLDKDTTGLLLLTDDGGLAHALLSPKKHVDKVYLAWVEGETGREEDIQAFQAGITLGDGTRCLPAELSFPQPGLCRVTVREGKYHQVKRMLASRGLPVRRLHRQSMGPLTLDPALAPGEARLLTAEEVQALLQAAR